MRYHYQRPQRRSKWWLLPLWLAAQAALAAHPPWPEQPILMQVQDQSLREFFGGFGSLTGVRILLSERVTGTISGRFDGPPARVFGNVVSAYGLLTYYDGTAVHVATSGELTSRTVKVGVAGVQPGLERLIHRDLAGGDQQIIADRSAGLIKLRGAPEFIRDAEEILGASVPPKLDPAAPAGTPRGGPPKRQELIFRAFHLRYASAADVTLYQNGREVTVPGVASMLRTMMGDGRRSVSSERVFNVPEDATVPRLRGRGLRRYNQEVRRVAHEVHDESAAPASRSVAGGQGGEVRIVAEPNLNAVIVRDTTHAMPLYEELILELDKEPVLVEIQVTIVDVDRNRLRDLGVDWRFRSDRTNADFGGGLAEDQVGGLILNTVLGDAGRFFARINALAEEGSAEIISRPQVLTLSNLEAVLASDESFFVRVAGNEEVDLFDVSVGTSLRVLPNVVGDASQPQVRLLVTIEDGAINGEASVDGIPVVERSSLNTQALIYSGESLLLGGLVQESESVVKTRVPLLGSVPGVGKLFQRSRRTATRTERLFLISPRLVDGHRRAPASPTTGPVAQASPQVTASSERYIDGY